MLFLSWASVSPSSHKQDPRRGPVGSLPSLGWSFWTRTHCEVGCGQLGMLSHLSPSGVQRLPGLKDKHLNLPPEDQVLLDKSRYLGHRYWSCKSRCSSSVVSMIPGRSQVTGSQLGSHVLSGKKKEKSQPHSPLPRQLQMCTESQPWCQAHCSSQVCLDILWQM